MVPWTFPAKCWCTAPPVTRGVSWSTSCCGEGSRRSWPGAARTGLAAGGRQASRPRSSRGRGGRPRPAAAGDRRHRRGRQLRGSVPRHRAAPGEGGRRRGRPLPRRDRRAGGGAGALPGARRPGPRCRSRRWSRRWPSTAVSPTCSSPRPSRGRHVPTRSRSPSGWTAGGRPRAPAPPEGATPRGAWSSATDGWLRSATPRPPAPGRTRRRSATRPVVEMPFSEVITIARHLDVGELRSYLNTAPLDDLHDASTPPPTAADESGRSAQQFVVDVAVRRGSDTRQAHRVGTRHLRRSPPRSSSEGVVRLLDGRNRGYGARRPGRDLRRRRRPGRRLARHPGGLDLR